MKFLKTYKILFCISALLVSGILLGISSPEIFDEHKINFSLQEVISIVRKHSIYKDQIDWDKIEGEFLDKSNLCQSYEEIYLVISQLLHEIGDKHGFILLPDQINQRNAHISDTIRGNLIEDGIGYINIPSCPSLDVSLNQDYAQRLQNTIKKIDNSNINGWVIDLRNNNGGNLWPMLLGLGPIIGSKVLGYFIDSENEYISFSYENGTVKYGDSVQLLMPNKNYYIAKCNKPIIAILIGRSTASSGEILAIALRNSYSKVFGEYSAGFTNSTKMFELNDGALLFITSSRIASLDKKICSEIIKPDVIVPSENDEVILKEAIGWIKSFKNSNRVE